MTPEWERWQRQRDDLYNLLDVLRRQYAVLLVARRTWTTGPIADGLDRAITTTAALGRIVVQAIADHEYRPSLKSWTGTGLNKHDRADFRARGITRR